MQTAGLSGPGAMAYDAKRVNALTGFRTLFGFDVSYLMLQAADC